ncbi:MAG: (Fe-S)-binding protein [Dehalococcoidia bacterium]
MASRDPSSWPNLTEAPDEGDLTRCVHCGLCVTACPTYLVTGLETESPRGRIALARGVADGRIPITGTVEQHWDRCLQCRACEVACPSAVPYGRIMEALRAQVAAEPRAGRLRRRLRRTLLRQLTGRRKVLQAAVWPARALARLAPRGLRSRFVRRLLPAAAARLEAQIVRGQGGPVRPGADLPQPAEGATDGAILFTGCVMGELFGEVHRASARVLARRGIAVEALAGQQCCGALSAHDGDMEHARTLAKRNIEALGADSRPIIVNAAGCGAALKDYRALLAGDPEWSDRAVEFSGRVKDFTEYLGGLASLGGRLNAAVAYQDACHLAHVQRVVEAPRALLRAVDGCTLVETAGDATCCGAAGLYGLLEPELSSKLRARKAEQFARTAPDIIATANPGCHMQYAAATRESGITARVMHIAEVLDEAERAASE